VDTGAVVGTKFDYAVILFYFFGIFAFGSIFARFTRSTKDFFFGNQRFAWWLIAFSCVATTVGSYSFVKYSEAGFKFGLSSTMTYLNDWVIMGLFLLTWLPIIYFSRVSSVPEYFERRFDSKSRAMATIIILLYMIGYIGINLYTMGVAVNALLGTDIFWSAVSVAVVCSVYVMAGGQTAVIMTDLVQGILLLAAGFALFAIGLSALGGWDNFWNMLPEAWRLPFAKFNTPHEFPFVGIFWQDGISNNIAAYFMSQGMILRFLSIKSVRDGKKTLIFLLFILMPLAAIATSNAGWLGKAFVEAGLMPADTPSSKIFVNVADLLCRPGVFGLIMAALIAALMSTIDTLINAVAVVSVNDIYRPYIVKNKSDRHYLVTARIISLAAGAFGIVLVPIFQSFKSIYVAHGAFIASVTPPMVAAILMGAFWRRFTTPAAFWTLLGGSIAVALSIKYPLLITPFAQGVAPEGYTFMRAVYGIAVSAIIGVLITAFTKPRDISEIKGLVIGTLDEAKRFFKGGEVNEERGKTADGMLKIIEGDKVLSLHQNAMTRMKARIGDIIYLSDARRWLGGLRSIHAKACAPHDGDPDIILVSRDLVEEGELIGGRRHVAELIF
jgi:SSS family solute:Na+ symporter